MKNRAIKSFIRIAVLSGGIAAVELVHAQPSISSISPSGAYQFQPSSTLSFTASSGTGVTNVSVQLTATTMLGQSSFRTLTPLSGLTVTGPATSETVSCSLRTNFLYTAVIHASDASGNSSTTVTFDTINPAYTWEAEDWDYTDTNTMASGQFINNPQTNGYVGHSATSGADYNNNSTSTGHTAYRPNPPGLATEGNGDKPRLPWSGSGLTDYDVGWNDGGNWGNYTRAFPAGTYNIYMRGSDGGGQASDSASISVVSGTASLSANGTVSVPNVGGWQAYSWVPFKDSGGSPTTVTFDGSLNTLRITTDGGSYNVNFYMLLPTNAIGGSTASDATITNVYPDGAFQFESTNQLAFNVISTLGVGLGNISVTLNGTNAAGVGFSTNLGYGSGLTITGSSTSWNVTAPLTSNTIYLAAIQVTDANGNGAFNNATFDTISPSYTWEAEDWDYGDGQYFDNPQTNAYAGYPGDFNVDYYRANTGGGDAYFRANAQANPLPLATENASDVARVTHVGAQDYDIGFTGGGNWANYTRNYPSGIFNMYVRASRGDGGSVADAGSVAFVTSGFGTSGQTTSFVGRYGVSSTGNWQRYAWSPVRDNGGNLARLILNGSTNTLRVAIDGGGHNQNFFMLLPADLSVNPLPFVSSFSPDSSALFQFTNAMAFTVSSSVGIANGNILVNLDGVNVTSGLTFSGTSASKNVTCPVTTNALHTVIITMTDAAGTGRYTNTFATYSSADYQWEAEDYNYGGGQYFDGLTNAYQGLSPVLGVDCLESDLNGANGSFVYRPSPNNGLAIPAGTGDVGGELPRAQFTSGGGSGIDYNIGYFGPNSWANYTRHYPLGTYNVAARVAEGNNPTEDILYLVSGDTTSSNQTRTALGTFYIPVSGWSSWRWTQMVDSRGAPARITLDGTATTLQLGGSLLGHDEANVNFLMLVPTTPAPPLTVSHSGGNIVITFVAQTGYSYQVQFKNNLTDSTWNPLGSAIPGNNAVHTVNDPITGGSRYYRVQIQ